MTADLRDPQGAIRQVPFGTAGASGAVLRAARAARAVGAAGPGARRAHRAGRHERPSERREPGRRNSVFRAGRRSGRWSRSRPAAKSLLSVPLGAWRGVGAAARPRRGAAPPRRSASPISGTPGVLRPAQPSDTRPVPVLTDPQTAAVRRARRAHRPDGRRPPGDRARGRGPQPLPDASPGLGRVRHRRRGDARGGPGRAAARSRPARRAVDRHRASRAGCAPRWAAGRSPSLTPRSAPTSIISCWTHRSRAGCSER